MANCVSVITKCCLCRTSLSFVMAGEPGKRHYVRAQQQEAAYDWLNMFSLGTMSASAYIGNVAYNSTCLINYQELTRSIELFLDRNGVV